MSGTDTRSWKVLIIDDAPDVRDLLSCLMREEGFEVVEADCGEQGLKLMRQAFPDVVLLDLRLPDIDGLTVLREIRKFDRVTPILLVTACGDVYSAVEAMKGGACDYVTKPFSTTELILAVRRALETRCRRLESHSQRAPDDRQAPLEELMGPSEPIQKVLAEVKRVAPTDFTVIISGETGCGKELVARAIHRHSRRAAGPFVPVDCGAIQPNLIESELFGHEKGAFTGADRTRPGKFEDAAQGTLFLDEIQNLPLAVQTRLLRALQEKQICHVGGSRCFHIDIRVLVATNQDLPALVAAGRFRQDLYHRLNEFRINLPPLRERRDDILYLARRFINLTHAELQKDIREISREAIDALLSYRWPGNVRELRNVIRRAVLLADARVDPEHLGLPETVGAPYSRQAASFDSEREPVSLKELVRQSIIEKEREILVQVLQQTGGNKAKAARLLQVDHKTIRTKTRQYGIHLNSSEDNNHVQE